MENRIIPDILSCGLITINCRNIMDRMEVQKTTITLKGWSWLTSKPLSHLCVWNLDFLTGRPQVVRVGSNTYATLILNTGAPQGCVLSPFLYSLFTHDCMAGHNSNTIIKFADDTTVVGLI
jgi:hypothetical protein